MTGAKVISQARDTIRHALRSVGSVDVRVWTLVALVAFSILFWAAGRHASVYVDGVRYHYLDDDQMISMRYARNLAEGQGLAWNAGGEHVEGYTNFGWTLVMAAVHALGAGDATAALWVRGVNWLLAGLVLVLSMRLFVALGLERGAPAGAALLTLALSYDFLFWAVNGFETTLLTALFLWGLLRALDDARLGRLRAVTCLLAGLLPIVRADAVDLTAAVVVTAGALGARKRWWLVALAAVPLALHLAFRLNYYGDMLPNTYYLKVAGRHGLFIRALGNIKGFVATYTVAVVLATAAAALSGDLRRRVLAVLIGCGFLRLAVVGPDIFGGFRFLAPYLPVLLVAAVAGIGRIANGSRPALMTLSAMLCLTTVFTGGVNGRETFRELVSQNGLPASSTVAGVLINRYALPDSNVVVVAAGCISYFGRRDAIDMLGKSDWHVARVPEVRGGPTGHNRFDIDWTLRTRPDIIASFSPLAFTTGAGPVLAAAGTAADRDYGVALALNPTFVREYRDHTIPVTIALQRNAFFVHDRSPETARLGEWHEPVVVYP